MTKKRIDYILLCAVIALVLIGLLFVYSASNYAAEITYGNKYFFLIKQLIGAVIGIAVMLVMTKISLKFIKKLWIAGVIVSVVLLCLVFVPGISIENYGARRWIGFGSFSMQPSEIAKFSYVLFCAVYMSKTDTGKFRYCLLPMAVGAVFCGLIIAEPNMSITMCMAMLMIIMLYLGGMKWKFFLLMLIPIIIAVPLLIIVEPYRLQRLLAFIDPWASPKDEGYQLIQSLYALGNGGLFGRGLFNSTQKYRFLPFAESDFILSIMGEELGFIGLVCFFLACGFIIYRGFKIARKCTDSFGYLLAAGFTLVYGIQVAVNALVVSGAIPPTGLPLPLISSGNTSLIITMASMGVLYNISRAD